MISRLFRLWRILATGFAFSAFGLGAFLAALVLSVLLYPLPIDHRRKRFWTRRTIRFITAFYVRMLRLLGLLSFEYVGLQKEEAVGKVVIANHPSLLDAVFIMSYFPNVTCLVKSAMAENVYTSRMIALADYIPNSLDGEGVIEKAVEALKDGQTLVIFPEGTRTVDFARSKFHRGAANIALAAKTQIQPIFIECEPATLRKGEPWYHVPKRRPHFRLTWLDPVDPRACTDQSRPQAVQARQLTNHMYELLAEHVNGR